MKLNTSWSVPTSTGPFGSWLARYRKYADNCARSGFVPKTHKWVQMLSALIARFWVFIQIGSVKVIGAENLDAPGRLIYCPNHVGMHDGNVLYPYLMRRTRFMFAAEEMRGFWGLRQILTGAAGAFPVDRDRGGTVVQPAIDALTSGDPLFMFPEGKISKTGELQPLKTGAARIALGVWERVGRLGLVGIVPIYIHYHSRHDESSNVDFLSMGLKWRGGVTVVVGEPIYMHQLPSPDKDSVTAALETTIRKLASMMVPARVPEYDDEPMFV